MSVPDSAYWRRFLVAFLPFVPAAAIMTIGWWYYGLVGTLAIGGVVAAGLAHSSLRRPALAGVLVAGGLVVLNLVAFTILCALYCD